MVVTERRWLACLMLLVALFVSNTIIQSIDDFNSP
jgi:hypothetical protein